MKHTMTDREAKMLADREAKMLADVMQVVLDAHANPKETFLLVQVLMANVLLGIMRDRVVSEPEILSVTMQGVKSAMAMLRRIKASEDAAAANVA